MNTKSRTTDSLRAVAISAKPRTSPLPTSSGTVARASSVPLDPATCLALKPIHDIGNQAMKERDEWIRWCVGIARLLNVSCANFASDVVADQYAELRDRITQALNASTLAHEPEDAQR